MPDTPIKRSRKRVVIRRDQLPADKLATTKAPPKPKPKRKPAPTPKAPVTPPSEIRLDNLSASLNAFDVWRNYQPLAHGIEKQIFQLIANNQLSASKRVVQRLLRRHTRDERYLRRVQGGSVRLNLDGTEAQVVTYVENQANAD